jgi:hypothetical protein
MTVSLARRPFRYLLAPLPGQLTVKQCWETQ